MEYIEQPEYDAIAAISTRIHEISVAIESPVSLQTKLGLLREQKDLIEQRSKLL